MRLSLFPGISSAVLFCPSAVDVGLIVLLGAMSGTSHRLSAHVGDQKPLSRIRNEGALDGFWHVMDVWIESAEAAFLANAAGFGGVLGVILG